MSESAGQHHFSFIGTFCTIVIIMGPKIAGTLILLNDTHSGSQFLILLKYKNYPAGGEASATSAKTCSAQPPSDTTSSRNAPS